MKNWSLICHNGVDAVLSPAYDLVSTIQYVPQEGLALNLRGSMDWNDVTRESFARLARKAGAAEDGALRIVDEAVERTRSAWFSLRDGLPVDDQWKQVIDNHWRRVPLLRALGS